VTKSILKNNASFGARLGLIALMVVVPVMAEAVVLYDASSGLPSSPPWLLLWDSFPFPPNPAPVIAGGALNLDTSPHDSVGYGYVAPLLLDPTAGYRLAFNLRIDAETHSSVDRAGFSIIAVSSDPTKAIELSFWEDQVWTQNTGFTHGESAALDTMTALIQYELLVSGMNYELLAGGSSILSGAMRDYSGFGLPYSSPNFLSFGDNTSSGSSTFALSFMELTDLPSASTPEPGTVSLLLVAGAALVSRRRRRR